eukprot:8033652-Lingulodinium_polyedra.AAC.1
MSGPEAVEGCVGRILRCFPSEQQKYKPEETLQLLNGLQSSPTWKLAPSRCLVLARWVFDIVKDLVADEPYKVRNASAHPDACHDL